MSLCQVRWLLEWNRCAVDNTVDYGQSKAGLLADLLGGANSSKILCSDFLSIPVPVSATETRRYLPGVNKHGHERIRRSERYIACKAIKIFPGRLCCRRNNLWEPTECGHDGVDYSKSCMSEFLLDQENRAWHFPDKLFVAPPEYEFFQARLQVHQS
jgi:hypothetical protein